MSSGEYSGARLSELDDNEIRSAVRAANIPVLLMLLYQFTGDDRWLQDPYRPTRTKGLGDHDDGGLNALRQSEVRDASYRALLAMRQGTLPAIPAPRPDVMLRMMSVCVGEPVSEEYGDMLASEFARRTGRSEGKSSATIILQHRADYDVIIIGGGVAGLVAARALEKEGLNYTILESAGTIGGTWRQNKYPGAGVDTPSHLYSYSFRRHDWARHFELQPDIEDYLVRVARDIGAERRVSANTEVLSARFDEVGNHWIVQVLDGDGVTKDLSSQVLLSAVGVLNIPKFPDVPGREAFDGLQFHSSEWPLGLNLQGKRVALVGTGATAMQILPAITEDVQAVTVFQRSPQWVAPFEKFQTEIPRELRKLLQASPIYFGWYWLRLFWQFGDKVLEALEKDPSWAHPDRSVNSRNDSHRAFFTRYLLERLAGRDDLISKTLPTYPPFGKRILLDNGWYTALRRPNVELVNEAVEELSGSTVLTQTGAYEADVVVWATGFQATRFLSSIDIYGRGGRRLREVWGEDDPRAYLGISVPEFPNFFMLGGPNSFPGSGSFMFHMELQMDYIVELIRQTLGSSWPSVEPKDTPTWAYNDDVDARHDRMIWTHPGMDTYYRNSAGRVVFVMPYRNVEYWQMTRRVDLDNYSSGESAQQSSPRRVGRHRKTQS